MKAEAFVSADTLTSASRADLARVTREAASRLDYLTTTDVNNGGAIQDMQDHQLVWTLFYLADVVEGRKRN